MIPERLLPIDVSWVQPGTTSDSYGNTVPDWSDDAVTATDLRVMIEQRTTVEQRDGRDVTVTTLLLFTNELAVAAIDRFVWADRTYEIDGEPAVVYTPAGPHHTELALQIVEG